mgnify:CR=1 FL=1
MVAELPEYSTASFPLIGAANAVGRGVSHNPKQRPFDGEGDFVSPKEAYSIQE